MTISIFDVFFSQIFILNLEKKSFFVVLIANKTILEKNYNRNCQITTKLTFWPIFDLGLQKKFEPKIWAQNFFGGLNQKSAEISMCKIHIYIDSESFRQIHWKM